MRTGCEGDSSEIDDDATGRIASAELSAVRTAANMRAHYIAGKEGVTKIARL